MSALPDWSAMANQSRLAFGQAVTAMAESDESVVAISADTIDLMGLRPMMAASPERVIEAGIAEGIDADTSRDLVLQTFEGAVKLVRETGIAPAELRRRVTTPNGVTQRGIETFQSYKFRESVHTAIHNAVLRSKELGEK